MNYIRRPMGAALFAALLGTVFVVCIEAPEVYAQNGNTRDSCSDFVTGGGFFFGSTDGTGEVDFGFNIGFQNGQEPDGQLNLVDHNTGRHVQIESVESIEGRVSYGPGRFFGDRCHCREFTGKATTDGIEVNYRAEVCDLAEPGEGEDKFGLLLCDPASPSICRVGSPAQVYLAIGFLLEGGNIQLHKACLTQDCP